MSDIAAIGGLNFNTTSGEIELTELFSEQMSQLCMSEDYSDVIFIVEGTRLPAHRVILAARSEYFRAMLFGGLSETTQSEINLSIPLKAFEALLKYIYSGRLTLLQMTEENILDTLGLVNQFGFTKLEQSISYYLRHILSVNNICLIFDSAILYNLDSLKEDCYTFMDRHGSEVLAHETFKTLSKDALESILARDSFYAPEVEIFEAVCKWCQHNPNMNVTSVVSYVRLPLITLEQLLTIVRQSSILEPDKLLDAIEEKTTAKCLPYRGVLYPEENVAVKEMGASTIIGEHPVALLDAENCYDMDNGYTRHSITDCSNPGIVVKLGNITIINHVKILLWDQDNRSYSYILEVSVDQTNWERVIDYRKYLCRSWQFLYFPKRAVRYIKLVGTHNTVNKVLHVVALEASYTNAILKQQLIGDIICPEYNVATVKMSALVLDGVSRTRNALINGDYSNYDWDSGYTCHQLHSGAILLRLGQPYIIGSMRLLLWDCDDRTYSFYIESSADHKTWEMVVDKRQEQARSWQNLSFRPRPMVFIRIVGTRNTANEIFHCVHFECPSQDPKILVNTDRLESTVICENLTQSPGMQLKTEEEVEEELN